MCVMTKRNLSDELIAGVEFLKQQRENELDKLLIERSEKVGQGAIPAEEVRKSIIASLRGNSPE